MRILLLYLLSIFNYQVFAQKMPDLNLNKLRINLIDKTIQAEIKPVIPEPIPQFDRSYFWYSANQVRSTQGGFSGKLLNGAYSEFYLNKNLKTQGFFIKGLKTGKWKHWNKDGLLKEIQFWQEGVKAGNFQLYDTDGKLMEEGIYRKNLLHGIYKIHHNKDSIEVKKYHKGILIKHRPPIWRRLKFRNKEGIDSLHQNNNKIPAVMRTKTITNNRYA